MEQSRRLPVVRRARQICGVSAVWSVTVGASAVVASSSAHSIALLGFGLESAVDGIASVVLLWRFDAEGRRPDRSPRVEQVARRFVGAVLIIVAIYVGAAAIRLLVAGSTPARSYPAVLLASASLAVLPFLSAIKLSLAGRLESGALRADGVLSGAGAALAAAVLVGFLLNDTVGWGWADSVAAICIAAAMSAEGGRTLRTSA